ncbi:hypothetical protein PCANC_07802 [Puccinia coronata f. sp. avenae]|uniref:Uncharacterized protein n=1 Tax=Puccinia coronata f. sp. avenae TaxID=200324 RepID=A0A2N5VBY1_9BASI|nr:hypothetical protein PCANC_07802 [Puccinia coronata f. sp. avenae]
MQTPGEALLESLPFPPPPSLRVPFPSSRTTPQMAPAEEMRTITIFGCARHLGPGNVANLIKTSTVGQIRRQMKKPWPGDIVRVTTIAGGPEQRPRSQDATAGQICQIATRESGPGSSYPSCLAGGFVENAMLRVPGSESNQVIVITILHPGHGSSWQLSATRPKSPAPTPAGGEGITALGAM